MPLPTLTRHRREVSVAAAIVALGIVLALAAPGYFSRENLSDLFLASLPVLIVALGATLVILTGEIDISVGSVFAICGVLAGVSAKAGLPMAGVRSSHGTAISGSMSWIPGGTTGCRRTAPSSATT